MTLYLSDLDGTLLNYAGKLKPRAFKMLNRFIKNNGLFSFATARGIIGSINVTKGLEINIPVITMNGAIIADYKTGERISVNSFNSENQKIAYDFLTSKNETPLVYSFIDGVERVSYLKNDITRIKNYLYTRKGDPRLRPCNSYDELFAGDVFYYCLINAKSSIDDLNNTFNNNNGFGVNYQQDTYFKNEYWYEVYTAGVSKGNAAKQLMKIVGADRLVVFGDNLNDLSMFEAADESYAVSNAHPVLKEHATGIIASNNEFGVPILIEKQTTEVFQYNPKECVTVEPDNERFKTALNRAVTKERSGIGTLNEKLIHSVLKGYFCDEIDHEAKIGGYYADAINENGIYEIQTASWGKLIDKLDSFLSVCHVTVVYPFEKRVHNIYIDENTGELIKRTPPHVMKKMSAFFIELYRIKEFLTNPNLTICIAELEIEKSRLVEDERCIRKRKQKVIKTPLSVISEIYLEKCEDYRIFLPPNLPETFDKKTFGKLCKISEAAILLEILEYMSIVHKHGKSGNSIIYSTSQP